MTPPPNAPPAPGLNQPSERPVPQTSTLGSEKDIMQRFKDVADGKNTRMDAPKEEVKVEAKTEAKVEPPSKTEDKKESSILPAEKTVAKKEEPKKEEVPLTEQKKVGPDGLTKEERAELVGFKKKAERVDELEAKVKDHEATAKERDELKTLRSQLEEKLKIAEAKAAAFDVSNDENYRTSVIEPLGKLGNALRSLCEANKIPVDDVVAAIEMSDESKADTILAEFAANLNDFTKVKFQRMVSDIRDIGMIRNEMISKAPEAWQAIQLENQKRAEAQKARDKETYVLANQTVLKEMQQRFPFLKDPAIADEILKEATELDFASMPPDVRAYYAQTGQAALRFNGIVQALQEENESLKEALGRKNGQPGPTDGQRPAPSSIAELDDEKLKNLSPGDRFLYAAGKLKI